MTYNPAISRSIVHALEEVIFSENNREKAPVKYACLIIIFGQR